MNTPAARPPPTTKAVRPIHKLSARLGASALLVVGLVAGPLPGPAATAGAPAFVIDWAPCATAPAVQCGTLLVPVDWAKPRGPRVPIAVARRPADQPATRIGTLFYNPGGPGDGGAAYVMEAERYFSAMV